MIENRCPGRIPRADEHPPAEPGGASGARLPHARHARRRPAGARAASLRAALAARAGSLRGRLVASGRLSRSGGRSRAVHPRAISLARSTSPSCPGSSSSSLSATPPAIPASGSSPPPTSASSRSGSIPRSRPTPPGTPSTTSPAPSPSTTAPIVLAGRERLSAKLSYTNIGFALAPERFSISELSAIYSAALGYPVDPTNLRRVLERRGLLEATGERRAPGREGGRPAAVYRFTSRGLEVTDPFAVLRPPVAAKD